MKHRKILTFLIILAMLTSFHTAFAASSIGIGFDNSINNLGYIYFDYNPVIYATVTNSSAENRSAEISAMVYDGGALVWSGEYQAVIPKDSHKVIAINTSVSRYGIFTLKLTVDGVCREQEFSIANRARDGVKNTRFGLSDHTASLGHGVKEAHRKVELFAKAGFSGLRYSYSWENVESDNGFVLPARCTAVKNAVSEQGMDIFNCLNGSGRYIDEIFPTTAENLSKWSDYVRYVMGVSDDATDYYEVRNEPNISDGVTPQDYFNLLKETYNTIHSQNPCAKVCAFAAANVGSGEGYDYTTLEWIEEVLRLMQADGGRYMDAVSIHTYNSVNPEADSSQLLTGRTWLIDETRDILDSYGFSDIPIVVSEMGWYLSGAVSEVKQAQYMIRYAVMNYEKAERIYWYVSQEKQTGNDKEDSFGIIKTWDGTANPYGAKPAFIALSNFNALMAGAELPERCNAGEGVYCYKFKDRFNRDLYIAWTDLQDRQITLDGQGKYMTVYDINGNIIKSAENSGLETITVSGSPVYVRLTDEAEDLSENKVFIEADGNSGIVTVNGISPYGNCAAGVLVRETVGNETVYINQIETASDGSYSFSFQTGSESGQYQVRIGFFNADLTQSAEFELGISVPELCARLRGERLTDIAGLHDGDIIDISLSKALSDKRTALIVTEYRGDELSGVKCFSVDGNVGEYKQEYMVNDIEPIEKIKLLYWDMDSLYPICGYYEIK